MAVRDVVQLGDPRLWQPSAPVEDPSTVDPLLDDLHDTLMHWRTTTTYGRGIAAPQIGVQQRVLMLDLGEPWPLINPYIRSRSRETVVLWDACLSFLTVFFQVVRHKWIEVSYQDRSGEWRDLTADDELSELLQHEIDHLDGMLALGRMIDPRTMCTRAYFEEHFRSESPYAVTGGE